MTTEGDRKAKKESGSKAWALHNKEMLHVRLGAWRHQSGEHDFEIGFIGMPRDLHGAICTCCKGSVNYREASDGGG